MATNRSPNYPAVSLREAIDLAGRLHQKEKQAVVDGPMAVRAWGYSGLSGVARGKLSALRKFGLLDDVGQGFRVSNRALAILHPEDEDEYRAAVSEAALAPVLFAEMASHDGASDDNLISRLIRTGFTTAGAKAAVASFRETMSLVSTDTPGYDSPHDEQRPVIANPPPTKEPQRFERTATDFAFPTLRYGLYDNVSVEIKVNGGPLTPRQISLLREYLALQEKAAPPDVVTADRDSSAPQQPSSQSPTVAQD